MAAPLKLRCRRRKSFDPSIDDVHPGLREH
jgi:hypothetical protein